ncbi:uncharacterized protein DUF1963 [Solirubrobacter pauli]|uniref:Uncharacterized protein DUF1963 n=1 Tax=Solirubrobacter pauli TaxID=166793 RepID=A0A660L4H7_9ACTN|nr:uncharacterized protein DUF1963 [Solirubrobacter pauli]
MRIGGTPDLVEGEQWPCNPRGVALTFIAQLEPSRLPTLPAADTSAAGWLGDRRCIRLFADLYDRPLDTTALVALVADAAAPCVNAAQPTRPPSLFEERAVGALDQCPVDAVPAWALDGSHPAVAAAERIDHGDMLRDAPLLELSHRLHTTQELLPGWQLLPRLLGPLDEEAAELSITFPGIDPELEDARAWTVLLQLGEPFFSYPGGLYVLIPSADLAEHRYDRALAGCGPVG